MAGITFQNDNWLGDAINGLDVGPSHTAKILQSAEQIKLLRLKQAAEQQALDEANQRMRGMRDLTAAYEKTLPQYGPTSELTTSLPTVDDSGQWSSEPQSFDIPQSWTDPAGAQQFSNKRDLAVQLFKQGSLVGKNTGDIAKLPELMAQSNVLMNGAPQDQSQREALQFATTGKFPDDGKPHLQNWYIKDAAGKIVGQGTMAGVNDMQTGKPVRDLLQPGQSLQIGSPITAEAAGPLGDQKARLNTIGTAMNDLAAGKPVQNPRDVALALGLEYPQSQKRETDAAGNVFPGAFDGKLIPPVLQPLVNHLNTTLYPGAPTAAPAATPPAAAPPGPAAAAVPLPNLLQRRLQRHLLPSSGRARWRSRVACRRASRRRHRPRRRKRRRQFVRRRRRRLSMICSGSSPTIRSAVSRAARPTFRISPWRRSIRAPTRTWSLST